MKNTEISTVLNKDNNGLKPLFRQAMQQISENFKSDVDGLKYAHYMCDITDTLLQSLYEHHAPNTDMAIIAVGGYGMGGQALYSDVDVLFLCNNVEACGAGIEKILYSLWDAGEKVGQAIHTLDSLKENIVTDTVFLTSVMTARFLAGNKDIFTNMHHYIEQKIYPNKVFDFVNAKMIERKNRHKNFGASRFVLEPNVKESKGGLRDFQNLLWIAKYVYGVSCNNDFLKKEIFNQDEQNTFNQSYEFMWRVRFALHSITGRGDNTLTFDLQLAIADLFGYVDKGGVRAVELFMQDYFKIAKNAGMLTRTLMARLDSNYITTVSDTIKLDSKDFILIKGRLCVKDKNLFYKNPIKILECFSILETENIKVHPSTVTLLRRSAEYINDDVREDPKANIIFRSIVAGRKDPARVLRMMNESGVLEAYLPEWKTIVCQMQYNMYHSYTTDEHTIGAIELLSQIEQNKLKEEHPLCTKIFPRIIDREAMYIAVLLHDIAKGLNGDHSILGEEVARTVCPRLGLDSTATETVAWLVRQHLTMSNIAQRRDVADPKTIEDFCAVVKGITQLDMLTVLTVVDTRAVGPNIWNNWKAELLRRLYRASISYISGSDKEDIVSYQMENVKKEVGDMLYADSSFLADDVTRFLKSMTAGYCLSAPVDELCMQARSVLSVHGQGLFIYPDEKNGCTKVLVHSPDRYGLMRDLSGAMAMLGANVLDAQIHTLQNWGAVNTFRLQDKNGGIFSIEKKCIEEAVNGVLNEVINIEKELSKRISTLKSKDNAFSVAGRVNIDNNASRTSTLIEIRTKNRMGLLYILTRELTNLGLKISGAKIATYGERIVDVFYVKDAYGFKLNRKQTQSVVKTRLLNALTEEL